MLRNRNPADKIALYCRVRRRLVCVGFVLAAIWPGPGRSAPGETPQPYRVAIAHVLVTHRDAFDGKPSDRSRAEASTRATDLRVRIASGDLEFQEASRRFSDDHARREQGGFFGIFRDGELSDAFGDFEKAAFALREGELSTVIESPLGFHALQRVPLEEWRARHVLLQFRGARKAARGVTRTRSEARAIAKTLVTEIRAALAKSDDRPTTFARFARRYSDAPDRATGGELGVFSFGERVQPVCVATRKLAIGSCSGIVESTLGFHVVFREALDARRFVLVTRSPKTKEERRDLGVIPIERLPKPLRDAASKLRPGEMSPPINSNDARSTSLKRLPLEGLKSKSNAPSSTERSPSPAPPAKRRDDNRSS